MASREVVFDGIEPLPLLGGELHNPKLRETILAIKASLEQVIDEVTRVTLIVARYDAASLEKAKSLVADVKQFIRENKGEIEAIKLLYSMPYRAGLRYRHVRELAAKSNRPPFGVRPDDPDSVRQL